MQKVTVVNNNEKKNNAHKTRHILQWDRRMGRQKGKQKLAKIYNEINAAKLQGEY